MIKHKIWYVVLMTVLVIGSYPVGSVKAVEETPTEQYTETVGEQPTTQYMEPAAEAPATENEAQTETVPTK